MRYPARLASLALLLAPVLASAQATPCKPTVTGHLELVPLTSTVFHNTRHLRVWLPPGYDDPANAQKKYPVLYILDGGSAFDACTAFHHDEMHADETLTELIVAGKIPPVIAVGVDNGADVIPSKPGETIPDTARTREFLPYPDAMEPPVVADVQGMHMPEFLERDVMPLVASRFRILTGPQNSSLWGDSYAGAAALYIAIERTDLFDRMMIESPSLQVGNGRFLRDSVSLTQLPHRIALGIGSDEASEYPGPNSAELSATAVRLMRTLAENLKTAAYTQTQVQLTVAAGARHNTGDFGKRFAAGLLFIYGK